MGEAPRLLDRLAPEDAEHFAEVRALLDDAGLAYEVDPDARARPRLLHAHGVRVRSPSGWARRAAIGGGGRYDGLVEQLGGPPHAGGGLGRRRRADPARRRRAPTGPAERPVYVAVADADAAGAPSRSRAAARTTGLRAEMEQAGRSMKGQLKQADRIGAARVTVIVGDGPRGQGHGHAASRRRGGRPGSGPSSWRRRWPA